MLLGSFRSKKTQKLNLFTFKEILKNTNVYLSAELIFFNVTFGLLDVSRHSDWSRHWKDFKALQKNRHSFTKQFKTIKLELKLVV